MNNKFFLYILSILFLINSCKKDNDFGEQNTKESSYSVTNGVYIVNEGNFNSGNSSISFLSSDPLEMENNIFYDQNSRPLGDVAQHIVINDDKAYIVVNNSGKIEVVDLSDFSSIATINGFDSPRYMQIISESKAFVTELYSDSIAIVNLKSNMLEGRFYVGTTTNSILKYDDKILAANWLGSEVVVADTTGQFIKSIKVTKEPNSMVLDKNGDIWVLTTGGWNHEEMAALTVIDGQNLGIEKVIEFHDNQASPSRLKINSTLDTLFFIHEHIYKMAINAESIPESPIINGNGYLFYGLEVDPNQDVLYVSDAIDYSQSGFVFRYTKSGAKIDSFPVGVIPGEMAINQTYYIASQSGN